jgi:glycosyltransferase involved in cell wall biosynthesis
MEILYISHKYPPSVGGMEKQSYELITRSSNYGKVHTILWVKGKEPKWKFFLNLKRKIKQKLKDNPDISAIHLNDGLMAMACHWLPVYSTVPVFVTLHGLDVVYPLPLFQKKVKSYYSRFSKLITVSAATRDSLIERGIAPEKIVTIHNGVDHVINADRMHHKEIEEYIEKKLPSDALVIVGIGRMVTRKGFSWFLKKVLPGLKKEVVLLLIGPNQKVNFLYSILRRILPTKIFSYLDLLVGFASDQDKVNRLMSEPELHNRVYRLSDCSYDDVMNILARSDLMIMPNIKVEGDAEGFGLVALEASINSTPVLASKIEGIKDAVYEGKNGWLLPSGDQNSWIEKINELADNRSSIKKASRIAHSFTVMNFSWDKMAIEYLEEFEKLQVKTGYRKYNYKIKSQAKAV